MQYSIESLIPTDIDFGVVKDPTLAYEFLYPKQDLAGNALPIGFYRKPLRYTLAASQSVEGRQRIVCGLVTLSDFVESLSPYSDAKGAFEKGIVVTMAVGPPPESTESVVATSSAMSVAKAVLSDLYISLFPHSNEVSNFFPFAMAQVCLEAIRE